MRCIDLGEAVTGWARPRLPHCFPSPLQSHPRGFQTGAKGNDLEAWLIYLVKFYLYLTIILVDTNPNKLQNKKGTLPGLAPRQERVLGGGKRDAGLLALAADVERRHILNLKGKPSTHAQRLLLHTDTVMHSAL